MKDAASDDEEAQREAVLQIAMLLEKHSAVADKPSFYEGIMPPPIRQIALYKNDERELLAGLGGLLESDRRIPDILWALGKSNDPDAFSIVVKFLRKSCDDLDAEFAWQALAALENFLTFDEAGRLNKDVVDILTANDPTFCVNKLSKEGDPDIKEIAQRIVRKISTAKAHH